MGLELKIEDLDQAKDLLPKVLEKFSSQKKDLYYADIRIELGEGKGSSALNGNAKGAEEDCSLEIGSRVYFKDELIAAGFAGKVLGKEQLENLGRELNELLELSFRRAKHNCMQKQKLKKRHAFFGKEIHASELAEIEVCQDTIKAEFKKNPRDLSLEELTQRVEKCSQRVKEIPGIVSNSISALSGLERKLFASSEGALIDSTKALTQAFIFVTAKGKALDTYYDWAGDYFGLEVLDGKNPYNKSLEKFAEFIAKGTVEVANAPAMKTTEKEVTVITDPKYNALLSHEITGHPSEADRALKREAAWAGRAWWFKGMNENEFGKQVASEELTVFSDPSLQGYGKYKYDDEGVKAKKVIHIDKGYLNEFLNSRETAVILGKEANGGMRANSALAVPLIRMNNTCFAPGKWKKEELFEETREGYYAVGQKIPSIGETRQNFKITCWKLFKIENGEITKLYRNGGITADSFKFLKSIDGIADDFAIHNIPNCGKGTPIQTMRVGNGGPHIRAKAIVSGTHLEGVQ